MNQKGQRKWVFGAKPIATARSENLTSTQGEQSVSDYATVRALISASVRRLRAVRETRLRAGDAMTVEEILERIEENCWDIEQALNRPAAVRGERDAPHAGAHLLTHEDARRWEWYEAHRAAIEAALAEKPTPDTSLASTTRPHVVMPSPGAWLDWRPVEELTDEELERQSQDSLTFVSGGVPTGTLAMEEHSKVLGRGFAIDAEVRRRAALGEKRP